MVTVTRGDVVLCDLNPVVGTSQDSVVLCEQIRVIDKSRIIRVIGHLDDVYIEELGKALCKILGLPNSEDNSQE
ncbi:type II toxin-antitoxin system PemK/MazF family toxin [Argonema antarcticum]|uniref:type II toxin-antitoxin system PemK/MazF family toxin n=1 Tax=Argonema antarcticum TaxID=2942763 RepID=UPI0020123BA7|nr:type II toxin-antitoxin system PemK/MazF family toxin [Argonema antarcticum A004/B2]